MSEAKPEGETVFGLSGQDMPILNLFRSSFNVNP